MTHELIRIAAPDGKKLVRFFRLQYAVRQTANNRWRLAQGKGQVGRRVPRLVSIDYTDVYMVPESWTLADAPTDRYFAVFLDGEYYALPGEYQTLVQRLLDDGKIVVLPMEGLRKW